MISKRYLDTKFSKNEKAIMKQWGKIGIPSIRDLEYKKSAKTSNSKGKRVTINGNHVLIKD